MAVGWDASWVKRIRSAAPGMGVAIAMAAATLRSAAQSGLANVSPKQQRFLGIKDGRDGKLDGQPMCLFF